MRDLVGQIIGNYRIEAHLGSGGMAQVYKGVHRFLNRPAAIKVMLDNLSEDPTFQARFLQEAKTIGSLKHPNIVEIFDFGEHDGRYFLVMELVTHGSLLSQLRKWATDKKEWPWLVCVDLIRQTANGLAYAHDRGILHRDIKPDNILLARLNSEEESQDKEIQNPYIPKITDFGLARLMEGTVLTATGSIMGTPAYMSPEQCESKPLDQRSDIYALGVVLYEVVTGVRPFDFETPLQALYKHVHVPPTPPRKIRSDCPKTLEDIILKCLAKRPEDRFSNARELSVALLQMLEGRMSSSKALSSSADPPLSPELPSDVAKHLIQTGPLGHPATSAYPDPARIRIIETPAVIKEDPREQKTKIKEESDISQHQGSDEQRAPGEMPVVQTLSHDRRYNRLLLLGLPFVALLCIAGGFFYMMRPPEIKDVSIEPSTPKVREPVTISWKIKRASHVQLQPLLQEKMDASPGAYTFSEGFPAPLELTLVASNRFGKQERGITVPVVLSEPKKASEEPGKTPTDPFQELRRQVRFWQERADQARIEAIQLSAQNSNDFQKATSTIENAEVRLAEMVQTPSLSEEKLKAALALFMQAKNDFNAINTQIKASKGSGKTSPAPGRQTLDRNDALRVQNQMRENKGKAKSAEDNAMYQDALTYERLGDEQFQRQNFDQAKTFYEVAKEKFKKAGP